MGGAPGGREGVRGPGAVLVPRRGGCLCVDPRMGGTPQADQPETVGVGVLGPPSVLVFHDPSPQGHGPESRRAAPARSGAPPATCTRTGRSCTSGAGSGARARASTRRHLRARRPAGGASPRRGRAPGRRGSSRRCCAAAPADDRLDVEVDGSRVIGSPPRVRGRARDRARGAPGPNGLRHRDLLGYGVEFGTTSNVRFGSPMFMVPPPARTAIPAACGGRLHWAFQQLRMRSRRGAVTFVTPEARISSERSRSSGRNGPAQAWPTTSAPTTNGSWRAPRRR